MGDFTTTIYLIASSNNLSNDLPYLQKIAEIIYQNHALLTRDWIGVALAQKKQSRKTEGNDWKAIVNESIDAIKRADLVIAEISSSDFSQGVQAYIATRHKKPTLILTHGKIEGQFISGLEGTNKYITVRPYSSTDELDQIITSFITQHSIPQKDLRFNLFLDRPILKYLRDKSYETGKNKSEIVRELLEREIKRREG